jgi:molecular chaperone HscA
VSKNGYLQIHDPLKPKGHAVGIDLGTTNSLVASVVHGKPQCLPADEGDAMLLPSVVHYAKEGGVVTGARARKLASEYPTDTRRRASSGTTGSSRAARAWCASRWPAVSR